MDWISTILGVAEQAWDQFKPLSNQQKQQNAFEASEAQKGRDFSAQQAELERDWQEEMYAKYNSLSGKIEQAHQAGVNPMYAVTGSAVSPMSPSGPSTSAPVAGSSGLASPTDMVGSIMQFSKIKAEIDQMKAYTREANGKALISEIDALTRGELNEASIAQAMASIQVSQADVSLKNAQVGELAQRVLVGQADVKVKTAQLGEIASRVALNQASTNEKIAQLGAIAASIANTEMDTRLKAAHIALVGAQTRSERLMSGLITENTKLSRDQRKEVVARTKKIYQNYDHDEIINAFQEAVFAAESNEKIWLSADNELEAYVKWIFEAAVEVLSFGGYVSTNTSRSTNQTTTTVVDGNDYPTRGKIGFN